MRGMRAVPQGVEEQHVQPAQKLHGFRGDVAVIGKISGASKTKPVYRAFAVTETQRCEVESEEINPSRQVPDPGSLDGLKLISQTKVIPRRYLLSLIFTIPVERNMC